MTAGAPSQVFYLVLSPDLAAAPGLPALAAGLKDLTTRAGGHLAGGRWGLKVHLGRQGLPAAVDPRWVQTVGQALRVGGRSFTGDTLSITVPGLDQADSQLQLARDKGYVASPTDLPWRVADGPDQEPGPSLGLTGFPQAAAVRLAAGFADCDGWAILNPVRPHPHAGLRGVLTALGVGLVDRPGKIHLHRPIRPQVDTPLCAGCGSCLAVCLFDAIELKAGRAMIDHGKCTGCGACMTVCHMAGISPEEAAGIPLFQQRVAAAAAGLLATAPAGRPRKVLYLNFMMRMDGHLRGARKNSLGQSGHLGVLAGTDPVALDQAAWDLIARRAGGALSHWSGFLAEPGPLLERAEELGLGHRAYDLLELT